MSSDRESKWRLVEIIITTTTIFFATLIGAIIETPDVWKPWLHNESQALQETAMAQAVQQTVEARDTATAQAVIVATTATREVTTTTQPTREAVPTQDTTAQTETTVAQEATDEAQRSKQTETAQEATTLAQWAQETETALRERETAVAQQATDEAQRAEETTVAQQATGEALREQERIAAQRAQETETAVAQEATEAAPKVGQCPPTAEEAANLFGGNVAYWRPLEGYEEYAWKYGPAPAAPIGNFNIPEGMKGDWWDGNAHSKQGPAQGGEAFEATIWCVP